MIHTPTRPVAPASGGSGLRTLVAVTTTIAAGCTPRLTGDPFAPDAGTVTTGRQDELYAHDVVQTIALDITPADLATLEASIMQPDWVYVPATFRWNDITLDRVGVRFKGGSSHTPPDTYKRSFLVKFDEFVADQDFIGLRRVGLDNGFQFGSLFSERLLNDVLLAEGVPASRTNYARLEINGVYKGVYVNTERVDKRFLARNFADNDGDLYKCDGGGAGARLQYLGDDPAAYTGLELQTNETTSTGAALVDLIRTVDAGSADELAAAVDLDALLALMPTMMLGGAFDQYTGFQAHNYYLYQDPATQKWTYIAHDLDVGFADNAFGMVAVIDGWDAATPRPVSPLPLVDRVLDDPALLARYRTEALDQLSRYFEPGVIGRELDALYAQITDDLASDPYPDFRITNPDVVGYDAIVADLKAFMQRRYDTARARLDGI